MYKYYFLKILFLFFICFNSIAYDFSFQDDNNLLKLDFEDRQIKEIKFDLDINGQRNFGLINYHNDEIYIILNTIKKKIIMISKEKALLNL